MDDDGTVRSSVLYCGVVGFSGVVVGAFCVLVVWGAFVVCCMPFGIWDAGGYFARLSWWNFSGG